jgi:hypothetical protein
MYGLIAGAVGLVINICISAAIGLCGPFVALLAGAAAGFFTAQAEKAPNKNDGARAGAISGAIAGGVTLVGQLIGGVAALVLTMSAGIQPLIGTMPESSDVAGQAVFLLAGLGVGLCFGMAGVLLSALAGAGTGYLGTPEPTTPEINHQEPQA